MRASRRLPVNRLLTAAVVIASIAGCAQEQPPRAPSSQAPSEPAGPEFPPPIDPYEPQIDPADFGGPIDNPYLPWIPGTTTVFKGMSEGEKERIVVHVTERTKEIMGVTCVVVKDVVWVDGELAEKTLDWYAQDRYGNVWYFGENSKEFENGRFKSTHGSWEAGVDGAQPGIVMLGDPRVGDRYRQEFYEGEAEDFGRIARLGASVTVPYGPFDGVLVTKDWTPLEPGFVEHKYYAPGVGVVREIAVKGAKEQNVLVDVRKS